MSYGHHELVCPSCGKRVGGCRCIAGHDKKVKDTAPCWDCRERLRAGDAIYFDFDANAHADAVHDKIKALGNPHRPIDAKGTT